VPENTVGQAEAIFEGYLRAQALEWQYEALPGKKKPDYVIEHRSGKCIFELKEIEGPPIFPKKGFDPGKPVRKKIERARTQFKEYKDHCCNLTIFSSTMLGPTDPGMIAAAAFGPGYHQPGRDYSKLDPKPAYYRFFNRYELREDLHFLADAALSPVANRSFSALVFLSRYGLNELHLEVWRRLYARQEAGEVIEPTAQATLLEELGHSLRGSQRYAGTVRVAVIENRYARIPFPEDLFRGPFDQRWGWNDDLCGPVWIGAELEALYQSGVPFHML
jgi:hypothetical protein